MDDLKPLISLLAKLPGMGPRSAKRAVLHLLKKPQSLMIPLAAQLRDYAEKIETCATCGNIDLTNPCYVCRNPERQQKLLCVVDDIEDLWAIERTQSYRGLHHVLGGTLSALDGIRPDDLNIEGLLSRLADPKNNFEELILALPATVDGQSTAHYLIQKIQAIPQGTELKITQLAHGVPVGGELDYLDEGTLTMAFQKRG